MATKRWSVLGFKMKKSVPLPSGPRKAGPQNNGTVPHDSSASSENSSTSKSYEGMIDLNVSLPDGRTVQMSVESKVPMMDLLIQVTVPNKINPSGHVIQAPTETGNSYISYKPSTPIGALGTNTIYVVPKNLVIDPPRKIGPKVANQPFEQTFRLQVHLPQNQKTFLRVSPKTLLAEVLSLVCKEKGFEPVHYDVRDPARPNEPLELGRSLSEYKLNEIQLVPTKVPDFRKSTSDIVLAQHMSQVHRPPMSKDDTKEKTKKKGLFTFKMPKKKNKSSLQNQQEVVGEWSFGPSSSHGSDSSHQGSLRSVDSSRSILSRPLTAIVTNTNITRPPPHKKRPAPPPPVQKPSSVLTSSPVSTNDQKDDIIQTKEQTETNHSRHSSDSSGYHEASILSDSPENSTGDTLGQARPPSRLRTSFDDTSLDSMEINNSKMPSPVAMFTVKQTLKPQFSDTESSGHSNTSTLNKKRRAPNPPARPPPPASKTNSGDKAPTEETTANSRPPRPPLPLAPKTELKEKSIVVLREKPRPIPRPRSSIDEDMKANISPRQRRPCSFVAPPPPPLPDSPSDLPSPVDFNAVLGKSSSQSDVATETMQEFKTTCDKDFTESHDTIAETLSDTSTVSLTPSDLNREFQETIAEGETTLIEEKQLKEGSKSEMARFVESMTSMTVAIEEDNTQEDKQDGPSKPIHISETDIDKERKVKMPKRREKRTIDKQQILKTSEEHETSSEDDVKKVYPASQENVPLPSKLPVDNYKLVIKIEETYVEPQVPTTESIKDSDSYVIQEAVSVNQQPKKSSPTAAPRKINDDSSHEKTDIDDRIPYETCSLPRPTPRRIESDKRKMFKTTDDSNIRYDTNTIEASINQGKAEIEKEYYSAKGTDLHMTQALNLSDIQLTTDIELKDKVIEKNVISPGNQLENQNFDNVSYVIIEETIEMPSRVKVVEEETGENVMKIVEFQDESQSDDKHDVSKYDNKVTKEEIPVLKAEKKVDIQENETPSLVKQKNDKQNIENNIDRTRNKEENVIVKHATYHSLSVNGLIESDHNGEEKKIILDQKSSEKESVIISDLKNKEDISVNSEVKEVELSEDQKRLQDQYLFLQQQFLKWQQQLLQNQTLLQQKQLLPEAQLQQLQQQQLLLQQTLFHHPFTPKLEIPVTSSEIQSETNLTKVTSVPNVKSAPIVNVAAVNTDKNTDFSVLTNKEFKTNIIIESADKITDGKGVLFTRVEQEHIDTKEFPSSFPFKKITPQVVSDLEKLSHPMEEPYQSTKVSLYSQGEKDKLTFIPKQTDEITDEISSSSKNDLKQSSSTIYKKWEPPSVVIGSWAERPRDNVPIKTEGTREVKFKPPLFPKMKNQFKMPENSNSNYLKTILLTNTTTTITMSNSHTNSIISSPSTVSASSQAIHPSAQSAISSGKDPTATTVSTSSISTSFPVITPPAIVPVSLGPKPFKATWKTSETLPKPAPKSAPVVLGFGQRMSFQTIDSDVRAAYRNYSRSVSSPIETETVVKSSPIETQEVFNFSETSNLESKNEFPETNRVKNAISRFSSFSGSQPTLAPIQPSRTVHSLSPPAIPVKTVSLNSLNRLEVTEHDSKFLQTDEQRSRKTQSMHSINTFPYPSSPVLLSKTPTNIRMESSSQDNFKTVIRANQNFSESLSKSMSSISNTPSFAPPPPPAPSYSNFIKGGSNTLPKASSSSKPRFTMVKKDDGMQSSSSGDVREELMNAIRNFGGRQQLKKVSVSQASWHFGTAK